MAKSGKKHLQAKESWGIRRSVGTDEGLQTVVDSAHVKFDETVDASINLGIDPTKGEQTVRGSVLLPHGRGKKVRVIVFAKGDHQQTALDAGADVVGAEDLVEKIANEGWLEFDAAVATPDLMGLVGKVARILGPRGLLPNKKVGTVTTDIAQIVQDLKRGRVSYRNDKGGVVHAPFGKVSFGKEKLRENLEALVRAVQSSKPTSSRGKYRRKVTISLPTGTSWERY